MSEYGSKKECTPGSLGYDASKVARSEHNPADTPMRGMPSGNSAGNRSEDLTKTPRPSSGKK